MEANGPLPFVAVVRHVLDAARRGDRGCAVDVGAHVGSFSRELLESGLFARVVAFEPNPANLPALEEIAAANPALSVVRAAVGSSPGRGELRCDEDLATGSLLEYVEGYSTHGPVRREPVEVVQLDVWWERAAPGRVDLVKIDTQGNDLAVLQGAGRLLARDRPLVVAEMIYLPLYAGQADPEAISSHMRDRGYVLHSLFHIHATVEGRLAFADAFFVPAEIEVPRSQRFVQLDDFASWQSRIAALELACRERLEAIEKLDAEVTRLAARRSWPFGRGSG